jgi:phospholipid transport system substrate-binding protein|tara:strand:+ start:153 stop:782 length:630 start_codon:yes stop_codon:yes gene_type:complete
MTGLNLTNKEMRRLIVATTVLLTIALFSTNSFSYSSDPKTFISELVNDAITTLSDKNISKKDKKEKISTVALQNIDIDALGMYTLGQARKSLDQETLKNYQKLFEKYFLKNLTSRLTDYSSQKFEVLGAEQKSETYTIVSSRIIAGSGPEIKIDWRVYTKDPAKPLIRDLIVEGLSLAKTQKEEFASILNSNDNDINILFLKLEEFINN